MTRRLSPVLLAIPQLVLYGVPGLGVITAWVGFVLAGAATAAAGIGIVILAAAGFALTALAWLEERRAAATFGLDIPERHLRTSTRSDGWRYAETAWLQWTDRRTWIALVHALIISTLGLVAVVLVGVVGLGIAMLFAPTRGAEANVFGLMMNSWWVMALGVVVTLLAGALLFGLGVAHRSLSQQFFVPDREAELRAEATAQSTRRTQAMQAAEIERTRIERDLHDGVQPRLVSVAMTLGMAKRKLRTDPDAAERLIDEAHASTKEAVTELRQLVRGIHPAVLQDRGLDAALSALVGRSVVPVELRVDLPRRYPAPVEAAVYFAVAESMTNAAKHADASRIRVLITEHEGRIWARIDDNGRGGASAHRGGGLDGVLNRVTAAGGTFSLSSPEGGPTTVEVSVPCAS